MHAVHAEEDVLPFIERMCESPKWEPEYCQVLADKCWCGPHSRAVWLYKEYMQLVDECGRLPDGLILRIIAAFRHPVRFNVMMMMIIVIANYTPRAASGYRGSQYDAHGTDFCFLLSCSNIHNDNDNISPCTLIFSMSTQARREGACQNMECLPLCHAPWQLLNREAAVMVSVLNKPCRKSALYLHDVFTA